MHKLHIINFACYQATVLVTRCEQFVHSRYVKWSHESNRWHHNFLMIMTTVKLMMTTIIIIIIRAPDTCWKPSILVLCFLYISLHLGSCRTRSSHPSRRVLGQMWFIHSDVSPSPSLIFAADQKVWNLASLFEPTHLSAGLILKHSRISKI